MVKRHAINGLTRPRNFPQKGKILRADYRTQLDSNELVRFPTRTTICHFDSGIATRLCCAEAESVRVHL